MDGAHALSSGKKIGAPNPVSPVTEKDNTEKAELEQNNKNGGL